MRRNINFSSVGRRIVNMAAEGRRKGQIEMGRWDRGQHGSENV